MDSPRLYLTAEQVMTMLDLVGGEQGRFAGLWALLAEVVDAHQPLTMDSQVVASPLTTGTVHDTVERLFNQRNELQTAYDKLGEDFDRLTLDALEGWREVAALAMKSAPAVVRDAHHISIGDVLDEIHRLQAVEQLAKDYFTRVEGTNAAPTTDA